MSTSTEVSDASTPSAQPEADRTAPSAALDPAQSRRKRGRRRFGLSIQSKLLIMLLAVSLLSSIVVSVIGYVNGRDSLRDAAFQQLTTIRELRTGAIEREFASLQQGVVLDSRNASAVEGARAFISGFDKLQSSTLTPAQTAKLAKFYETDFVPKLEQRSGLDYATDAFIPASPAGRYIQSYYTAGRPYEDFDAGLALADAGDGSAWSKANAEYGPYFTGLVDTLGYEDTLIIDRNGNVAYSAYKSVDLGINLREEPYASSSLTKGYQQVLRNGSLDEVVTTDFERYLPSLNVPTAWVMSPIGTATDIIGVLAVQVPIDPDQRGDDRRQEVGATGAGTDRRGLSRGQRQADAEHLAAAGRASRRVREDRRRVRHAGQHRRPDRRREGDGAAATGGLHRGQRGTGRSHRGGPGTRLHQQRQPRCLRAAGDPGPGLGDRRPHRCRRGLRAGGSDSPAGVLLSLLGIVLVVSLLSLLLAQVFTRPINRLVVGRPPGGRW